MTPDWAFDRYSPPAMVMRLGRASERTFFIITTDGRLLGRDGKACKSWDEVFALVKPWLESQGIRFEEEMCASSFLSIDGEEP